MIIMRNSKGPKTSMNRRFVNLSRTSRLSSMTMRITISNLTTQMKNYKRGGAKTHQKVTSWTTTTQVIFKMTSKAKIKRKIRSDLSNRMFMIIRVPVIMNGDRMAASRKTLRVLMANTKGRFRRLMARMTEWATIRKSLIWQRLLRTIRKYTVPGRYSIMINSTMIMLTLMIRKIITSIWIRMLLSFKYPRISLNSAVMYIQLRRRSRWKWLARHFKCPTKCLNSNSTPNRKIVVSAVASQCLREAALASAMKLYRRKIHITQWKVKKTTTESQSPHPAASTIPPRTSHPTSLPKNRHNTTTTYRSSNNISRRCNTKTSWHLVLMHFIQTTKQPNMEDQWTDTFSSSSTRATRVTKRNRIITRRRTWGLSKSKRHSSSSTINTLLVQNHFRQK